MWRYIKSKLYAVALLLAAVGIISPAIASAAVKIQTSICGDFMAPTVTSPITGFATQNNSVIVVGKAEASLSVAIIENGTPIGITTVSSTGDYSISAPLAEGDNSLVVREMNGCGTTKESGLISVQRSVLAQSTDNSTPTLQPTQAPNAPAISLQPSSYTLNQPVPNRENTQGFGVPIISQPSSGATYVTRAIWVAGTAEPSSTITIYVSGKSVARLRASPTGGFGVVVELQVGSNAIQVGSEKDGKSAISKPITVTYTPQKAVEKSASPIVVAATAAAVTVTAVAATSGGVWAVKFINVRRLR